MKKIVMIAIGMGMIFAGIFGGLFLTGEGEENKFSYSKISIENKKIVDSSNFMEIQGSVEHDIAADNQFEKSEEVIYGRITKVDYLIYHNTPWTKLEIACKESFKGDIEKDQRISAYVLGGYLDKKSYEKKFDDSDIPMDDDVLVEMKYFQNELSKVGDEGVFYLVSDDEDAIFEKDAYFFLCSGYSKMMYDKKSGDIKETAYEGVKKVPKNDFFSKIKAQKKQIR